MDPGVVAGLGLGGFIVGAVFWALVLRPRWLLQAFEDSGRRLRARVIDINEPPAEYSENRGLGYFTMGDITTLSGKRMLLSGDTGGPEIQIDLLALHVQARRKNEMISVLLLHSPLPGAPMLRIQRCSGLMRKMFTTLMELAAARMPAGFTFETQTPLDQDHLVGTNDIAATQEFLNETGCQVVDQATHAVEKLVGAHAACLIRSPQGISFLVQQPTSALVKEDGLRAFVAAFRPVVEWFETRALEQ